MNGGMVRENIAVDVAVLLLDHERVGFRQGVAIPSIKELVQRQAHVLLVLCESMLFLTFLWSERVNILIDQVLIQMIRY